MGSSHRQKVTSKMIFLLHCTGLAQLSFYASLVGAYNFTTCNHTAIKTEYHNMLKDIIAEDLNKENFKRKFKNCCTIESEARLLGCIYNFTKTNLLASEIWNFTNALLKNYCHGNIEVNGSQNHQWTKCNPTSKHFNHIYVRLELREMWYSYEAYEIENLN